MRAELKGYVHVCEAVARLFAPYVEVVLHDVGTEKVVHVANNFSRRKLGAASLLHQLDIKPSDHVLGPYTKTAWDGRRIKSISVVIRDVHAAPVGVLCLNVDTSEFESVRRVMDALLALPHGHQQPEALFRDDWDERIHAFIVNWTTERGKSIDRLTRPERRALVEALNASSAFEAPNAAAYVADILRLSRATIYNYLKAQREQPSAKAKLTRRPGAAARKSKSK